MHVYIKYLPSDIRLETIPTGKLWVCHGHHFHNDWLQKWERMKQGNTILPNFVWKNKQHNQTPEQ